MTGTTKRGIAPEQPQAIPGFPTFGHITLQGVDNARDLGGMPTEDGKRIKSGRLLRSGDLAHATAEDAQQLMATHHLARIVDLRTPLEAERAPDPLELLPGVEYVNTPSLPNGAIVSVGQGSLAKDAKLMHEFTAHPFDAIKALYPEALLGELGIKTYGDFLHGLLEAEEDATLWHCTQGKDRTGMAAILVEHALGVSQEHILADYLATNLFIDGWMARMERILRTMPFAKGIDADIDAYAYAHAVYFEAAMEAMNSVYGSIDAYLGQELHFGPAEKRQLRAMYLE